MKSIPLLAVAFLLTSLVPPPALAADAEAEALVQAMLSQRPLETIEVQGHLSVRHRGRLTRIPLRYTLQPGEDQWIEVYESRPADSVPAERLIIIHRAGQPTQYLHSQAEGPDHTFREPVTLSGQQAAIPFAGSDYWLSDLGLEFLHWPEQRLDRQTRITMRLGRPCHVLISIHPNPTPHTYARVASWVDQETCAVIYAEAYGLDQRRFKTFSLKRFRRTGEGMLPRELQLTNERTDSKTSLELHFDP